MLIRASQNVKAGEKKVSLIAFHYYALFAYNGISLCFELSEIH